MIAGPCSEDTLVRARRGELSPGEARPLEAHLASCALCRMSSALGRAVGPLTAPDEEDAALARRLVDHQWGGDTKTARPARVVSPPVRVRRWHGRTVAVAASLLLMASGASAAYWTVHVKAAARAAAARAAWTAPAPASSPQPAKPPGAPPPARATIDDVPLPAPGGHRKAERLGAIAAACAAARETHGAELDPETLLRDANAARRARSTDEAARAYGRLQARFPSSREAVLSHLSLGNLQLSQGAFADALAQFQAYLRLSGDGAELAEEALLGEARALAALGRPDDERAVWRTLETRFPRSEYSWRARQRLRELDCGAAP